MITVDMVKEIVPTDFIVELLHKGWQISISTPDRRNYMTVENYFDGGGWAGYSFWIYTILDGDMERVDSDGGTYMVDFINGLKRWVKKAKEADRK